MTYFRKKILILMIVMIPRGDVIYNKSPVGPNFGKYEQTKYCSIARLLWETL